MCSEDLQHCSFGNMTIQYSFIIQQKTQDLSFTKFVKSNYLSYLYFFRLLVFSYNASSACVHYINEVLTSTITQTHNQHRTE